MAHGLLAHAPPTCVAVFPRDAAGGEEHGVDRGEVVVLGVKGEHEGKKEQVGKAEPARASDGFRAQQSEQADDPEQRVDRLQVEDLGQQEGQERRNDVFTFARAVAQEL